MDPELMSKKRFPVTTICGSMRYKERMLKEADRLSREGWIVLFPFVVFTREEQDNGHPDKIMLDHMHFAKIDKSDAIHVVGTHIGESTFSEIAYARGANKQVIYCDPPSRPSRDNVY